VATDVIAKLLQDAEDLSEEKDDLNERREANRKGLRALADAGALTDQQVAAMNGYYPPRKRKGNGDN
jgi:hypothetical protein